MKLILSLSLIASSIGYGAKDDLEDSCAGAAGEEYENISEPEEISPKIASRPWITKIGNIWVDTSEYVACIVENSTPISQQVPGRIPTLRQLSAKAASRCVDARIILLMEWEAVWRGDGK